MSQNAQLRGHSAYKGFDRLVGSRDSAATDYLRRFVLATSTMIEPVRLAAGGSDCFTAASSIALMIGSGVGMKRSGPRALAFW